LRSSNSCQVCGSGSVSGADGAVVDLLVEPQGEGHVDGIAVREEVIDRGERDLGLLGDLGEADVLVAAARQQLFGRVEDAVVAFDPPAPHRPVLGQFGQQVS
jgi:hypothetical protein